MAPPQKFPVRPKDGWAAIEENAQNESIKQMINVSGKEPAARTDIQDDVKTLGQKVEEMYASTSRNLLAAEERLRECARMKKNLGKVETLNRLLKLHSTMICH